MIRRPRRLACVAAAAAALLLSVTPVFAKPPVHVPPRPLERTLDNGLRVVVFEDERLPIVQVQLFVPAGVTAERPGESGVAHFTAQMLRRGTPQKEAARFEQDMAALGAELVAATGRDMITIGAGFLAEDFEPGLTLVAQAAMRPAFANEEIGRMRFDIARTLIDLHANPVSTAEEQIWVLAYGTHPYARPPAGTVPSVLHITREQLVAFHERQYRPGGSALAVAGDVRADEVFEAARIAFADWSGQAAPVPAVVLSAAAAGTRVRIIDLPTETRTELRLALLAPEHGSASFASVMLANRAFADIPGARLQQSARGPGILGGVSSAYVTHRDGGLWLVRGIARTDSAGAAVGALRDAIAGLSASPPGDAEVAAATALHRATWPMELATLSRLLSTWGEADASGLAAEALAGYARSVDTLGTADIAAVIERWIDPARLQILAVGPAERLRPQLEAFGPVEVVQLEGVPDVAWATEEPTAEDFERGEEIIAGAVRAHGGRDKVREIHDSSLTADVVFMAQGREVQGRLRQLRKEPFKFREELDSFVFRNEQVLDGAHGWLYDSREARIVPADSLQMATLRATFMSDVPHLLRQATDGDARPIFRGVEDIGGRSLDVVEVRVSGEEKQLWLLFDQTTHHLVASDVRGGVPPQVLARRIFSDLRPVGGVLLPFAEERYVQNTLVMRIQVLEQAVNIGLIDAAFRMPEIRN